MSTMAVSLAVAMRRDHVMLLCYRLNSRVSQLLLVDLPLP